MTSSNVHVEFADGRVTSAELAPWRDGGSHLDLLEAFRKATNDAIARDRAEFEEQLMALPDTRVTGDEVRRLAAELEAL